MKIIWQILLYESYYSGNSGIYTSVKNSFAAYSKPDIVSRTFMVYSETFFRYKRAKLKLSVEPSRSKNLAESLSRNKMGAFGYIRADVEEDTLT